MLLKLLNHLFGAIFGTIVRPLRHLFLTLSLYASLMIALPIKITKAMIELSKFDLFSNNESPSYLFAGIATMILTPAAIIVTTVAAGLAIAGSVLLSPIIGFFAGLTRGLEGAFASTWLSTGLSDVLKSLFPRRATSSHLNNVINAPARIDENGFRNRNQIVWNGDLINFNQPAAPVNQPVAINAPARIDENGFRYRHRVIQRPQGDLIDFNQADYLEAQERKQIEEAKRISFEYNNDQYSFGNIARRVVNAYREPDDVTTYMNSLVEHLGNLKPNDQIKLDFLNSSDLKKLAEFKDENIQTLLKQYINLENRSCCLSLETLSTISDPVTVEVTLQIPDPETKQLRSKTYFYVYDYSSLHDLFKNGALNRQFAEILELRPHKFDGLNITSDKNSISGYNSNQAEIKIYRGIDTPTYTLLKETIKTLGDELKKPEEKQEPVNQLVSSTSTTLINRLSNNNQINSVSNLATISQALNPQNTRRELITIAVTQRQRLAKQNNNSNNEKAEFKGVRPS